MKTLQIFTMVLFALTFAMNLKAQEAKASGSIGAWKLESLKDSKLYSEQYTQNNITVLVRKDGNGIVLTIEEKGEGGSYQADLTRTMRFETRKDSDGKIITSRSQDTSYFDTSIQRFQVLTYDRAEWATYTAYLDKLKTLPKCVRDLIEIPHTSTTEVQRKFGSNEFVRAVAEPNND